MRTRLTMGLIAVSAVASACSSSTGGTNQSSGTSSGSSSSTGASSASGTSSGAGSGTGVSTGANSGTAATSGASTSGSGASSGSGSGGSGAGTGGSGSSSSGSDGGVSTGEGGLPPAPYPSGPYCAAVGSAAVMTAIPPAPPCVIQNLTWSGYVDDAADAIATSKPYRMYSLLDVYNDARASGKKYAMLNIAEEVCPGCNNSATLMGGTSATSGPAVVTAGGVMIEVLMTKGFTTPPAKMDLDQWVGSHSLNITTVEDLDTALPTSNELGRRDQAFIIDLTTMKIIQSINGNIGPAGNMNSGPLGMAAMHMLLGK